jgi:hypothetical protein
MKLTKESILKTFNSLTMPAWIKRVITLIIDYVDWAVSAIDNKADLVDGKVPAEQLPSYVDDVIDFYSLINGAQPASYYINNKDYTNRVYYIVSNSPASGTISEKYNYKFVDFGANTSEDDWVITEPEQGKIYLKVGPGDNQNHTYRWSGSQLIDIDKDTTDDVAALEKVVKVIDIGQVDDFDDISDTDQTVLNQNGLSELHSAMFDPTAYRGAYITFHNEEYDIRLARIVNVNYAKNREFTIWNNNSLQVYNLKGSAGIFNIAKTGIVQPYVFLDANNVEKNKAAIANVKTDKLTDVIVKHGSAFYKGFITKNNTNLSMMVLFYYDQIIFERIDNTTGVVSTYYAVQASEIVAYKDIRGSKTSFEAKTELSNILRGDTVVLNYTQAGSTLDKNTIAALKKASQVILLNDNTTIQNSKSVYTVVTKTSAYLYFAKVENLGSGGNVINYNELTVTLSTSVWNIYTRQFTLPYGCYIAAGFSNKNKNEVNNTLGRLLNADVAVIDNTDLGTTLSSDKLTQVLNCTWLLLKETNGKIREFSRGYDVSGNIYYNSVRSLDGGNYITINASTGALSALQAYDYGYSVFTKYKYFNGTKTTAESFYKEMVAQFTEDTYVIDNSKIGTVLTDADDAAIKKATSIVITNYNGRTIKLLSGNNDSEYIRFANTVSVANGGAIYLLLAYNISTKTFITDIRNISSYEYYKYNSTIDISVDEFNKINSFLYDNVFIIDKALINTTISNETVIAGLKRATMVIVKPTNNTEAPVIYIVGNSHNDSNDIREFFNISNTNETEIIINRLTLLFSTNKLTMERFKHKTLYATYTNAGGTKYTTEADFNAQFVKIMDMTVTE